MLVNIDCQYLCISESGKSGIHYYMQEVINKLVKRNTYDYELTFCDFKRERNNYDYLRRDLSEILSDVIINERNDFSYQNVIKSILESDISLYNGKTYSQLFKVDADISFFSFSNYVPHNIDTNAVVVVHDIMPVMDEYKNYWSERNQRWFKNSINYLENNEKVTFIADSKCTKKDMVELLGINEERINVVYAAYNDKIYYEDNEASLTHLNIDGEYILYLGALDSRKGIDTIVKAFDLLENRDIKLVLAGNYRMDKDSFMELINSSTRKEDIILTGFVSDDDKRRLMSQAEVFLFPSQYEGFGLPVLEAMACGAPVITTNVSSLPEVAGNAAEYIQPGDYEELAKKIDGFLSSKEKRERFRKLGFERIKNFSWDKTAESVEKIFEKILSKDMNQN